MKISSLFAPALVLACLVPAAVPAGAQTQPMTPEAFMAQQMKYAMPVAEHNYLKKYIGSWDVDITIWLQPGVPPVDSKGTMQGKTIFGGRYAQCDFQGTMMAMPFTGLQIVGFDRYQKKYVTLWIDDMSTHFSMSGGGLDFAGKVLTETGVWPDPATGGTRKIKAVTTWVSDAKFRWEVFRLEPDGKAVKSMELVYTRKT